MVFLTATGSPQESSIPKGIQFSFAPAFSLNFAEEFGRPHLFLCSSGRHLGVSTEEILLLRSPSRESVRSLIHKAVTSSKAAIVLLYLDQNLRDRNIPRTIDNGKIHFIYEPFDCVDFEIKPNLYWKLSFLSPRFRESLSFSGHSLCVRFVDYIMQLVTLIGQLFPMWRQIHGLDSRNVVVELDTENQLGFACRLSQRITAELQISLGPFEFEQSQEYRVLPGIVPGFQFNFGYQNSVRRLLNNAITDRIITPHFGAFLRSGIMPFYELYTIFNSGNRTDEWSISGSRNDRSFHLIYRKHHSLNLFLEPAQLFQFVVPSTGASALLIIPLSKFSGSARIGRLNLVSFQMPVNRLHALKESVEFFFNVKDKLDAIGFGKHECVDETYRCFVENANHSLKVKCEIHKGEIMFSVNGHSDLVGPMESFLNQKWDDMEIQMLALGVFISIRESDSSFIRFVIEFTSIVIAEALAICIDLPASLTATAAQPRKNRITFKLLSSVVGDARVELKHKTGLSIPDMVAWDRSGDSAHPKTLDSLQQWLESLII
jgi:hypothetical protein